MQRQHLISPFRNLLNSRSFFMYPERVVFRLQDLYATEVIAPTVHKRIACTCFVHDRALQQLLESDHAIALLMFGPILISPTPLL